MGCFFCCLIFDLVQFSFLLFLATSSISIQAWQNPTGSFFRRKKNKNKSKGRTFGIRRGFFEAYSHSLPILLSLGSSSCRRKKKHAQSINRSTTEKATTWSHLTKIKGMQQTPNLCSGKDFCKDLLVPLDGHPGPCRQPRAKIAQVPARHPLLLC